MMESTRREAFTLLACVQGIGMPTGHQVLISLIAHLEESDLKCPNSVPWVADRLEWSIRATFRRIADLKAEGWIATAGRFLVLAREVEG